MSYYYFASSLPFLTMTETPAITVEEFRELCREHLSMDDRRGLQELAEEPTMQASHPFVCEWHDRETELRNELVRLRAERTGRDPIPYLGEYRGCNTYTRSATEHAFAKPTPLEREHALDRYRWQLIDELRGVDTFSGRAILAYALQLDIAAKWAGMQEEVGRQKADGIITATPQDEAYSETENT